LKYVNWYLLISGFMETLDLGLLPYLLTLSLSRNRPVP